MSKLLRTHPARLRNWFYYHDRKAEEVVWWRCEEVPLDLPRPLVVVNGCFDLLHAGHMKLIFAARAKAGISGTVLIAMDSDRRVEELKGTGRPILTWPERAAALRFMPVDGLVEIDQAGQLHTLLERLHPDLRVQGSDYGDRPSSTPSVPKMLVVRRGISTSEIIRRVREL